MPLSITEEIAAIYEAESRRVLATLIRLLGDFDRAEEALHDAVRAALEQWPRDGVPANPRAWLVSTGRFKAIDGMRRQKRFEPLDRLGDPGEVAATDPLAWADAESVEDDQLRLIFTSCHPALSPDAPSSSRPTRARPGTHEAGTRAPVPRVQDPRSRRLKAGRFMNAANLDEALEVAMTLPPALVHLGHDCRLDPGSDQRR